MNNAQRKYYNDRIETLNDEIETLKDKLDELDAERENLLDELAADEIEAQHREYERSV